MNPVVIAGLLKRSYSNFDMNDFNDRLKLQKFIYLIQECGLNLGYDFKLYLHGPYCTLLTRDGFEMPEVSRCKKVSFGNPDKEKIFLELLNFINNHKDNPEEMEILASLILFHRLNNKAEDKELIELVRTKDIKFKEKEKHIGELLTKIKRFDKIKW